MNGCSYATSSQITSENLHGDVAQLAMLSSHSFVALARSPPRGGQGLRLIHIILTSLETRS